MGRASDFRDPPLRVWQVKDSEGVTHEIAAHYCFNNDGDGRGLVFRRYQNDDPDNRTEVVAAFAVGHWAFYKEITSE